MMPGWITDAIRRFGERMGLEGFALNARGAASATFENGYVLALEYAFEALMVSVRVPATAEPATMRRLLTTAHWARRTPLPIRAAWLEKSSRAVFAARLASRQVTDTALDRAFAVLWEVARGFGGAK